MLGIFDSGVGGLTIAREIRRIFPEVDITYLGDAARVPYGNRSQESVYEFTRQCVDELFKRGATLAILACNTSSALALRKLQQEYLPTLGDEHLRILGVIRPLVEYAAAHVRKGPVGVLGTRGTVLSQSFVVELQKLRPDVRVVQQAAPLLVPLAEEGWEKRSEAKKILRYYMRLLKRAQVEVLLLGCTHYPVFIDTIRAAFGEKVSVPHPGEEVAASLRDYLNNHPEKAERLTNNGTTTFLTTDDPMRFSSVGSRFWGETISAEKIHL